MGIQIAYNSPVVDLIKKDNKICGVIAIQNNKKVKGTYLNNITTTERNYRKILDYWFISSSKYIDDFSNLFDFIPNYIKYADKKKIKRRLKKLTLNKERKELRR